MANLSNINNKFLVTTTGEVLIGQTANNGNRLQITGADGASYIYLKTDVATTGGRIGFNSDDLRVFNQQASGNLSLGTVGAERMKIDQFGQIFAFGQMRLELAATETNPIVGTNCAFMFQNTSNTDGNLAVVDFRNSTGFVTGRIGAQFQDAGDRNTDLFFMTRANGGSLTERMRIDSSGNVGINETSPESKFEISDTTVGTGPTSLDSNFIMLTNKDLSSGGEVWGIGFNARSGSTNYLGAFIQAYGYFQTNGNTGLIFGTRPAVTGSAVERMRIDSSGNVGIGTDSPQERLHIVGLDGSVPLSSYYGSLVVDNNGEAAMSIIGNSYSSIYFGDAATNFVGAINYQHSVNAMIFKTNDNTEKMRITSGGNVGIGTTSPYTKLEVAGDISLNIRSSASENYIGRLGGATTWTYGNRIGFGFDAAGEGYMGFYILDSGVGDVTPLFLAGNNGGRVGIGTTSPNQKLEVAGNIRIDSRSKLGSGEVDNITFTKDRPDAATGTYEMGAIRSFTTNGYSGGMTFYCGRHTGGGSYALISTMTIGHTTEIGLANVGIGTTTPSAKLAVISSGADGIQLGPDTSSIGNSGRLFWTNSSGGWAMMALGQVLSIRSSAVPGTTSGNPRVQLTNYSSTAWTASSDESLKENINSIGNVLDKIDGYRCIEYNLIDDEDKDKKIGFIAQDWQEDFPQIVEQMEDEKIGMKYTETIPILLKAIQELKARIKILENK